MNVVKICGAALKYAAEGLCADRELVTEAIRNNGFALRCASQDLRDDRELIMEAVKTSGLSVMKQDIFEDFDSRDAAYLSDRQVMIQAVCSHGTSC